MIVKNEEKSLPATLASARPYLDYWFIADTGSTDATKAVIREALADIPGELVDVEWDGFGPARSVAFAGASGHAPWVLAIDADMTVEVDEGWEPDPAVDAYTVAMGDASCAYRVPYVLNGSVRFVSIGSTHEYTARADGRPMRTEPTDAVRITHHANGSSRPVKFERDLAADPNNARVVFYLANTLRDLGRLVEARHLYLRRADMGGWEEESAYAAYQAALLAPPAERAGALLAAWERRPERLEPLAAALRDLNERSMYRTAWALAETAWSGRPPADGLFVDRTAWPQVLAEMSIAGWYIGRRDWSERIARLALADPDLTPAWRAAVERNLALVAA
jgi:hypothetical protein